MNYKRNITLLRASSSKAILIIYSYKKIDCLNAFLFLFVYFILFPEVNNNTNFSGSDEHSNSFYFWKLLQFN